MPRTTRRFSFDMAEAVPEVNPWEILDQIAGAEVCTGSGETFDTRRQYTFEFCWPGDTRDVARAAVKSRTAVTATRDHRQVLEICRVVCQSGKFETGEGTCSLLCMDQFGDPRKKGCPHAARIHDDLARKIVDALKRIEP